MKVRELIEALGIMPPDADVCGLYDGALRLPVNYAYLSRSGAVALAEKGDVVYHDRDRPGDAPTEAEDAYWRIPGRPSWDIDDETDD